MPITISFSRPLRAFAALVLGLLVAAVATVPAHAATRGAHRPRQHAAAKHARHTKARARHTSSRAHKAKRRAAVNGTAAAGVSSPAPGAAAQADVLGAMTGLSPSQVTAQPACASTNRGARCDAQVIVSRSTHRHVRPSLDGRATFSQVFPRGARGIRPATATTAAAPQAGTPAFLQQAYDLTYLSQTAGAGDTVAIVDAYDDPGAASDLATYRSTYGLPACTTANGCFRKVNQNGATSPLPAGNSGWEGEISLDLDAVSALCPNCHILLVEANTSGFSDMDAALERAAAMGAKQISNSWSGGSSGVLPGTYTFAGVSVLAATGDNGYDGPGWDAYPAAFGGVVAVGGTSLTSSTTAAQSARGFAETAWSGAGAGCDPNVAKPAFQHDSGCTGRSYADVSADAAPGTGLIIYDSGNGGWALYGGTSLATPLVAAYEALTNRNPTPQWPYTYSAELNDPTSGSDGSCSASFTYICNARAGYDGPTGAGSISGDVVTGAPGIGGPSIGNGSGNTYTQSVTNTGATLKAGIYPNGLATTYSWQYGTTTAYGQQTPTTSIGSGAGVGGPVSLTTTLSGLSNGTTYHYRLVATNSAGTSYGYDYSFTTTTQKPIDSTKPTISGIAKVGQVLTATNGTWSGSPTSYVYQWQIATSATSGWSNISGATSSTYTVPASAVGASIRVGVDGINAYGTGVAGWSAPVGPVTTSVPAVTVKPAISGTAKVGQMLTASNGTWSGSPTSYVYQWQIATSPTSGWSNISGATSSTYTVPASAVGASIRVGVDGINAYGTGVAGWSAPVGPVAAGTPAIVAPAIDVKPAVTGSATAASVITATSGEWTNSPTSYTYQWQIATSATSGWSNISGATDPTYTLHGAEVGASFRVGVTAANDAGRATAYSGPIGPVQNGAGAPSATTTPTVSGTALVGQVITASQGTWSNAPTSFAYRWQIATSPTSGWSDVPGATGASYTLQPGDAGASFRVVVTATNDDGITNGYSAPLGPVQ